MGKFKPTTEQIQILKEAKLLKKGEVLVVNALAGCAKTTTLQMIAEENLDSKFLYLAFNKNVVEDGKSKFSKNSEVSTLHAFARRYTGRKDLQNLNIDMVAEILDSDLSNKNNFFEVFNSLKVYDLFCNSPFSIKEIDDLKKDIRNKMEDEFKSRPVKNSSFIINQRLKSVNNIETIHNYILNSDFTTFPTFLKEFVETAENREFKYDYIVLDESQDVSKLLAKFIISLVRSKLYKVIIVGDNNQKIYGFLGNTNLSVSIQTLFSEKVINSNLTQSFRFKKGSKMETLSNKILELRGDEIFGSKESGADDSKNAYISRGTFPLLAMAIHQIQLGEKYNLFGGVKNFNIVEIKDIYNLYMHTLNLEKLIKDNSILSVDNKYYELLDIDEKIDILKKHSDKVTFPIIITKSLKLFTSFLELQNFVKTKAITDIDNNINIAYFIKTKEPTLNKIDNSQTNIVDKFFELINKNSTEDSNTIISTIHKTKGLEFKNVIILKAMFVTFDESKLKLITSSPKVGQVLGLQKIDFNSDYSNDNYSNRDLSKLFNSSEKSEKNIFAKKSSDETNLKEIATNCNKEDAKNKSFKKVLTTELILNKATSNVKEEYNILYVAITRAIENITISNINYNETLDFLDFINKNIVELINIVENRDSKILIQVKRKGKNIWGIAYKNSFISKKTILEYLPNL